MCLVLFSCTVGETSGTTVGSTTDHSSATTVPPMHSPAPHITSLPSLYQPLPSQLPQTATSSQLQQPRGITLLIAKNAGRNTGCIRSTSLLLCEKMQGWMRLCILTITFIFPCLCTFWHAILTSPFIFNDFSFLYNQEWVHPLQKCKFFFSQNSCSQIIYTLRSTY